MSPRKPSPMAAMINVVERYSQSDAITNPAKYTLSTARDPNRSAKIPAGNPPNPRKRIWIVRSSPSNISDTENSLKKRVLIQEHKLYPKAIRLVFK